MICSSAVKLCVVEAFRATMHDDIARAGNSAADGVVAVTEGTAISGSGAAVLPSEQRRSTLRKGRLDQLRCRF